MCAGQGPPIDITPNISLAQPFKTDKLKYV